MKTMIRKRDGEIQPFNHFKIVDAVLAAFKEVDGEISDYALEKAGNIADYILEYCQNNNEIIDVEEIQDYCEKGLMATKRKDVAKAYILYRAERTKEREKKSKIIQTIERRNKASNVENANANVDEKSFSGREKEASADIQKIIALDYVLSKEISEAHKNMLLYQHDLEKTNIGVHNCLNIDFEYLFKNGFTTRNGDIRPPASFATACQLVAVIFQCQSQVQFGGCGSVHIDRDLAPFVRKSFAKHYKDGLKYVCEIKENDIDYEIENMLTNSIEYSIEDKEYQIYRPKAYQYAIDMLEKEGQQATEALFHNLNSLESRAGSQVPFTSLNYGRDLSIEGKLVQKWLLNASLNGIGKHHLTPIFPISIYQYKSGENAEPGTPGYDIKKLAIHSLCRRIYPNFVNCDWTEAHEDSGNPDTFFSTMGCRTMLGYDRFSNSYNRVGRGNAVPNTMILPKLGIEYGICLNQRKEPDLEGFWNAFEDLLKLCEKGLLERFAIMCQQSPEAAPFMYRNHTMRGLENKDIYSALRHQTLAMGYIGIAETMTALFGKNHAEDEQIHSFALKIVKRISEYAKEASERNNLNFSCYATPNFIIGRRKSDLTKNKLY